jgi:glycine cleavage system H protein
MSIPANLRYTKTHEWVRIEGDHAVVGITEHAQQELSDVVYVELPQTDAEVTAAAACAVVESVKAASDIYAPISGDVIARNEELSSHPELVNADPYGRGWLFQIQVRDPGELNDLLSPSDYQQLIGG